MSVDIHMIRSPSGSFFDAQKAALAHPCINFHEAQYVPGSVVEARLQGFQLGTSPYVSWVDDDDHVLDIQWIDQALDILDNDPTVSAVFPQWCSSQNGTVVHTSMTGNQPYPIAPHHLTIMRRQNVIPLLTEISDQFPNLICFAELMLLFGQLRFGRVAYLPVMAYEWVQYANGASKVTEDQYTTAFVYGHIQQSLTYL